MQNSPDSSKSAFSVGASDSEEKEKSRSQALKVKSTLKPKSSELDKQKTVDKSVIKPQAEQTIDDLFAQMKNGPDSPKSEFSVGAADSDINRDLTQS